MNRLLSLSLLVSSFFLFIPAAAQQDTISISANLRDDFGKRHGRWTEFLDAQWVRTTPEEAVFYRFVYYDHGKRIPVPADYGQKGTLECKGNQPGEPGKPNYLHGRYVWKDKKGRILWEQEYKLGEKSGIHRENTKKGYKLYFYTHQPADEPWYYELEEYRDEKLFKKTVFRNGVAGYRMYED